MKRIKAETARKILAIGTQTSFVFYVKDRPVAIFDSLEEFCESTGRSMKYAQWMCTPTAKRKKTYIERVTL